MYAKNLRPSATTKFRAQICERRECARKAADFFYIEFERGAFVGETRRLIYDGKII